MVYNGFPATYQPMVPMMQQPQVQIQPQMQVQPQPQQQQGSGVMCVWVQGESGAKGYPVAAGTTVMLLDSENQTFYIKSTDSSGMPMPLRTFDFVERIQNPNQDKKTENYVTWEDFEKRLAEMSSARRDNRREKQNDGKSTV